MAKLTFTIDEVPVSTVIAVLLAIEERDGPGESTVTTSDYNGELTNLVVNLPTDREAEANATMVDVVGRLAASRSHAVDLEKALATSEDRAAQLAEAVTRERDAAVKAERALTVSEDRRVELVAQLANDHARTRDLEKALAADHALVVDLEQAVERALVVAPDREPPNEQEVYTCPEGCDLVDGVPMTWLTVAERDAHIGAWHPHLLVSWAEGDITPEPTDIAKDPDAEGGPEAEGETTEPEPEPAPDPDPSEQVDSDGRSAKGDYPCLLCAAEGRETRFMTRNGLVGHRHTVRVDDRLPFVCSCGKRLRTEGLWRNHRHAVASPMEHHLVGRPDDEAEERGDVAAEEVSA